MKEGIKSILVLLLLLNCSNVYARLQGQALIDSLLKELPKQKEDTNQVKLLGDLSIDYSTINTDEGIKYGQKGLELATKLEWQKGIGMANNCMGKNYENKEEYPQALAYYKESLKISEVLGIKTGIATVTNNIGVVYMRQSDYPKALEYFLKALKLDEELGRKNSVASVNCSIGIVYKDQGDYPKALEYYFKALKLDEELGDKWGIENVTGNIGDTYYSQMDYAKALEYLFKALKQAEESGNKFGVAAFTGNISAIYKAQKNYTMAVEYTGRALKLFEALGSKEGIAVNLCNMGENYIAIIDDTAIKTGSERNAVVLPESKYEPSLPIPHGKATLLAGAIGYLQRGLVMLRAINALDNMQECYGDLSEAYKLKGDYKKALEYADSSTAIKDSLFSQNNTRKITQLENKRKEDADSLKAAAERRAAAVTAVHRRNYELIGIGALALAIAFVFLLTRNNKLLDIEKKKSDSLLLNILPEEVAHQLKEKGVAEAKHFDNVTVLFTDFVNFTEAGSRMSPQGLIDELHHCFKKFYEVTHKYGIEKIKTIGDAYLAVAGLPTPDASHAEHAVRATTDISAFMQDRVAKLGNRTFEIRIGVHSGSVVAGIVGIRKFAYDIWGDTVNTAARMEQNSEAGRINISQTTYELVKDKFACEYRGEIDAKGKGMLKMYYVGGRLI